MKAVTKQFVLAGKAIFSIKTPDTHYTFRVDKVESDFRPGQHVYFVKMLTGPDNTSDYTYLGKLDEFTSEVKTTKASQKFDGSFPLRLLNRVLARVWSDDHAAYQAHGFATNHCGHCGRCGRLLTVPESVESGFGPECIKLA